MKNIIKLIGIIALVAAIGFSMAACDDNSGGGGGGTGGGGGGGGGGDSGGGSGFTVTGIPSKYNGKYAGLVASGGDVVYGFQTYDGSDMKYCRISNGRVSIPLWVISYAYSGFDKYSGNDTYSSVICTIVNYDRVGDNEDPIASVIYSQVKFSNGNATRAWNNGQVLEIPQ